MPSAEILSRLTAGSLDLTRAHLGGGGIPEISKQEIAGCLAGLSHGASYYAHYFFMGEESVRADLTNEIRLYLSGIWADHGWRIRQPGILTGLSELAVCEWTPEWRRCPSCNGKKGENRVRWLNQYRAVVEFVNCGGCAGGGERRITDRERQEMVGIGRKTWERYLRGHYERYALGALRRWQAEVHSAVREGLRS